MENELEFLARKILEYYNVPAPTLPQVNKPTVGNNIKKDKAALAAAAATSSATATTSATAVPNNSEESNISAPGAVENQEETTTPAPAVSFEVEASLATAAAVQPATSGSKQQKTPSSPSKRSNPELDKSLTKFNKSSNNASHSQTSGVKDGEDNIMKTDMAIIEALRTAVSSRSENLKTSGDLKLVTTPVSRPMTIDRASSALIHVANTRAAEQQQQHHHHAEHPKTPEDAAAAPTPPNSVTISNDVIEVRAIPLATLTNFRIKLQTRLFEYFEQYRSETMAFIQKKTVEGKAILRDESSTALFTMEVWYREIDEVSKRQHGKYKKKKGCYKENPLNISF